MTSIPELYRSLSGTQRAAMFDRKCVYYAATKKVLVRKGLIHNIRPYTMVDNEIQYKSKFTDLGKEMAEWYYAKVRKTLSAELDGCQFITCDEQLLDIFSEIVLYDQRLPDIYFYGGRYGLVVCEHTGDEYIIDPLYRWEIEIDKISGQFLKTANITSHRGSYMYEYDAKKGEQYVKRNALHSAQE